MVLYICECFGCNPNVNYSHSISFTRSFTVCVCMYLCWLEMLYMLACLPVCSVFGTMNWMQNFFFSAVVVFHVPMITLTESAERAWKVHVCVFSHARASSIYFPFWLGPSLCTSDLHTHTHTLLEITRWWTQRAKEHEQNKRSIAFISIRGINENWANWCTKCYPCVHGVFRHHTQHTVSRRG